MWEQQKDQKAVAATLFEKNARLLGSSIQELGGTVAAQSMVMGVMANERTGGT